MIRTCLFDMGNVLVYFCHDRMCRQIGELCGLSGPEVRRFLVDGGKLFDFERGRMTEAEFHRWFVSQVNREVALDALVHAGSDIFQLNETIVPVLDALKSAGYRLVLLSNTSVSHFEFVRKQFDVLDRFDECVVSFRAGAIKPEPAIFEAALRAIRCQPEECFYTDDIPAYIEAGRAHGLQAEVFTGTDELKRHLSRRGVTVV